MVTLGSAVSVALGQKPKSKLWSQWCFGKAESQKVAGGRVME